MNRAPQTDEGIIYEALRREPPMGIDDVMLSIAATARALGRADAIAALEALSTGAAPATPIDAPAPSSADLEAVASAIWKRWWREHGEQETEVAFPQLYETARQRWLNIAASGLDAYHSKKDGPKSAL